VQENEDFFGSGSYSTQIQQFACTSYGSGLPKLLILLDIFAGLLTRGIGPSQTEHRRTCTHSHSSIGIRTHNPSVRAVQNHTRPRPSGHWYRHKKKKVKTATAAYGSVPVEQVGRDSRLFLTTNYRRKHVYNDPFP
jgi:hypothetical protein